MEKRKINDQQNSQNEEGERTVPSARGIKTE